MVMLTNTFIQDEGEYVVNVTFCGVDVPKAPFTVNIYGDGPRNKVDPKKVMIRIYLISH